ncbi:hypothetical protein ACFQRK_03990 [Parapedobacter sp. GCM10030251]|uniref:hypothetical protein n=1 Tax=Parapedobacter sp. GCM10030251 TaxID=3273419 RepID=UPI003621370D
MDKGWVIGFLTLLCCLAGAPAVAVVRGEAATVADTASVAQQQEDKKERQPRKAETSEDKSNATDKAAGASPGQTANDIIETVKRVPKARRRAKPISVPSVNVNPPVKVKVPKVKVPEVKTAIPVKIKL